MRFPHISEVITTLRKRLALELGVSILRANNVPCWVSGDFRGKTTVSQPRFQISHRSSDERHYLEGRPSY